MALCRSCGAHIEWAETERGKRMPVEKAENGGNVILQEQLDGGTPTAVVVGAGKGTHVSHFATCPDAPHWRRKGETDGRT